MAEPAGARTEKFHGQEGPLAGWAVGQVPDLTASTMVTVDGDPALD
jgi:hypothetical protein